MANIVGGMKDRVKLMDVYAIKGTTLETGSQPLACLTVLTCCKATVTEMIY